MKLMPLGNTVLAIKRCEWSEPTRYAFIGEINKITEIYSN